MQREYELVVGMLFAVSGGNVFGFSVIVIVVAKAERGRADDWGGCGRGGCVLFRLVEIWLVGGLLIVVCSGRSTGVDPFLYCRG